MSAHFLRLVPGGFETRRYWISMLDAQVGLGLLAESDQPSSLVMNKVQIKEYLNGVQRKTPVSRKIIYTFSLVGFFLMWGVFGFAAATPRNGPVLQTTLPPVDSTLVSGASANPGRIPVSGDMPPRPGVLLVYGLFGLVALILILALLNAANKPATTDVQRSGPADESSKNNH